jgi:hypothetical protein
LGRATALAAALWRVPDVASEQHRSGPTKADQEDGVARCVTGCLDDDHGSVTKNIGVM